MTDPLDRSPLPVLPMRDPRGHKGTFGTVAVVGGCAHDDRRMIGAVALAATAALRAGAGLVRLVMPAPVLDAAITICPAATGVPIPVDGGGRIEPHRVAEVIDGQLGACDALVVGPGMGTGDGARTAALRAVQQEEVPVIVDADAINNLADVPELSRDFRAAAVLTPHPGEYRRLASSLRLHDDPVEPSTRPEAAASLARRLGCIVALKGAGTVVSDGQRTWLNDTGGPVLATAGTGDVLAGLIAGLAAQFVPAPSLPSQLRPAGRSLDLYDVARIAVFAHGRAGELWARAHDAGAGMLAPELAETIPAALESLRRAP